MFLQRKSKEIIFGYKRVQHDVSIVGGVPTKKWAHIGEHSTHLLEEVMSDVTLEIEFPSIRQISGEGASEAKSEDMHRYYLRPRITVQPCKGPAPVGSLKLWYSRAAGNGVREQGQGQSRKASWSKGRC